MFIRIGSIVFTEASFRRLEFHDDGTASLYLGEPFRASLDESTYASESREILLSKELADKARDFFAEGRCEARLEIYTTDDVETFLGREPGA